MRYEAINIPLGDDLHFLFAAARKEAAFYRPLAVCRNCILRNCVPKGLRYIIRNEKNFAVFLHRADFAELWIVENLQFIHADSSFV